MQSRNNSFLDSMNKLKPDNSFVLLVLSIQSLCGCSEKWASECFKRYNVYNYLRLARLHRPWLSEYSRVRSPGRTNRLVEISQLQFGVPLHFLYNYLKRHV